ncbi:cytochrome P450-like protein, partial [Euroglyphus maynei]
DGISRVLLPQWLIDILRKIRAPFFRSSSNNFFSDTSYHLIRQRRNNPNIKFDDMLQLMIKAEHKSDKLHEEDDKFDMHHVNVGNEEKQQEERILNDIIGSKYLSEEEIVAQCLVFFLAGYETTASTLTFCLYELAINPEIQDRLYEEVRSVLDKGEPLDYEHVMRLPYIDAVISETLRHHSPASTLTRIASEPYHLPECNYTLQKGEMIRIPTFAIHHNPKYYPDPDRFDPERFMPENRHKIVPYTYLPFGGGPRNCIGMRFALSEAKLGLARMISQFSFFKSPDTVDELRIMNSFVLLKTVPVHVGVRRRSK